jgi:ubiquinone/menaquinone biosynthesis C-methylase UbiE
MAIDTERDSAGITPDVTDEWIDPHLPTMFSRYHSKLEYMSRPTVEAIVAAARIEPGFDVLDVGCGSGIPTLALAELVGPKGSVTATDPSPVFIAAVTENVRALGLTNVTIVQTSAAKLPFDAGSFDAATCHFGVMFFPEMTQTLGHIRRTLKLGARAAFAAWGPVADNTLFSIFQNAVGPYLPPSPEPVFATESVSESDLPAPMRFAEPGSLKAELLKAGFDDVREETRTLELIWQDSPAGLVKWWIDLSGIGQKLPPDRLEALSSDLLAGYTEFADGDAIRLSAPIVFASGRQLS